GLDQRVQGEARAMLSGRRYAASTKGIDAFSAPLFALLMAVGGMRARRIAVIGDGAAWIWNWVKQWLRAWGLSSKEIIEIVDFWHAAERRSDRPRTLVGRGPEAANERLSTWRDRLREGEIDALIGEMEKLGEHWKSGKKREACESKLRYLREHRER